VEVLSTFGFVLEKTCLHGKRGGVVVGTLLNGRLVWKGLL
jgi:hypothetical protein